jgi:subtilase family serine protease
MRRSPMQIGRLGRAVTFLLSAVLVFSMIGFAFAQGEVQVNGYIIDVKGQEPVVPQDQEPVGDGKYKKWIVQFTGPIQEADKKALVDLGCRVGDYLPDFAFIVTMDNKTKKLVEGLSFINGIVRYKPAYKIDKKLKDDSGAVVARKGTKIKLIVKVDGKDNQSIVLSETHKRKGKVLDVSGDIVRIEVDQADISHFAQIEEVLWIEEATDLKLLNDTSKWTIQTYLSGNTKIWDKGLHGENQIVGIGDTGLDYDMPWFRDPSGIAIGPTHRKIVGYDTTYGDDYDANSPGHGTHVAGTVGGDRTPVDGLATANGMAPKSRFYIQDITPGSSGYVYPPSDLGLMFIKAYDAGARLHTNSWGGGGSSYNSMSMSADKFMWEHKDFLALFANGNSGPGTGTVGYPATAKNVVSVGAALNGTGAESMASFSSNGPTADGRIKPTITAPGDGATEGAGIISADSDGVKNSNNSGTIAMRGTSMATPTTAGAAALARQYYTEGYYPGGSANSANAFTPSAALIKATLVNSGQNMTGSYTDAAIPSTGQGWGRINLSNTLTFSGDTKTLEVQDNNDGLATGGSWSQAYFSTGDQPLKVTLVWTDYPGTVGAAKALVNDLDLTVTSPDGATTYLGNVFTSGESATGGTADRLNVEEQVLLTSPAKGSYTITVSGYNIPNGPQPYAIVITGASGVTSKGMISLNKGTYNASGTVEIKVADLDLNTDGTTIQEVYVAIKSTTETNGERVRLVETGADTSIFTGTISLRLGAPVSNNGYLEVMGGDTLTAAYEDADDGTGAPATVTAAASIDITPPAVSAVTAGSLSDIAGTITWTTDEKADSTVNYGETTSMGAYLSDYTLTAQHSLNLSGLKEAKTYYYEVYSTDEAGNLARDNNGGTLYTFTTINVPPVLTVSSSNGTETYYDTTVIYGTATDHSGVASVTVNGTPATYRSSDGYYELSVSLNVGTNTFTVVATDTLGNAQTLTITVNRLEPPDLVMAAVAGPASAGTGGSITVSNTVTNNGPGDSKAFYVGLYLSTDAVCETTDIYIGNRYLASLLANNSSQADTTVTLPSSVTPGTYYICAIADYTKIQYESDDNNNGLAGNQITVGGADLVMSVITYPATGKAGQTVTVGNTVTNISTLVNAGYFYVAIYLSTDNTLGSGDTLLGTRYVSSLASGASSAADTVVTLPTNIIGTYYLIAQADYYNSVKESDETNNALAGSTIEIAGADLTMSAVSYPATGKAGQTVTVSNTVTAAATGGNAGYFYVAIYLSTDNTLGSGDTLLGTRYVSSLASGASSAADTVVTLPTNIIGTYYLIAQADYYNSVKESDETNNALAGSTIEIAGADLTMSAVSYPATGKAGQTVTVSNTVTAAATGGNAGYFYVAIYLSTDNTLGSGDTLLGTRYVSSLASGASSAADTVVTLPTNIIGTYYLIAQADYYNSVKESDETNNALAGSTIEIAGADLTMSAVSYPATGKAGQTVTVSNTVTAAATGGNAGYFYVAIYLSTDNTLGSGDTLLGTRYVSSLASGASSAADTVVTLPTNIIGTYYLIAQADYYNSVKESDETNNALAGSTIEIAGADLTMSAVSYPATGKAGQTVTVSNTVTAAATGGNAGYFYVAIYLSTDNTLGSGDTLLGTRYVSSLASGASSAADTVVTLPTNIIGTYYLIAQADYYNSVKESDETNNALAGSTIEIAGADLTMSAVSYPATGKAGQTVTVSNTVTAAATGGNAGYFYVAIYLSTDNTLGSGDTLLGTRYVSSLASGASSAADTVVTLPTNIIGTYYLIAQADYYNSVKESDETNNALAGDPITVTM